ncbi:VPEID-CTERM sorting domain-containing protein [Sulfitobacter aestuarii]|uniref:VPEID-CTERM sorting domain-containing protein n=1 Tax=Sulfitobacter aestuarii TaxID=2161676 RepID=A0ABW5U084_9RHOB
MKKLVGLSTLAMFWAGQALATVPYNGNGEVSDVPEISAVSGAAALAVLGATVALMWERRRRR